MRGGLGALPLGGVLGYLVLIPLLMLIWSSFKPTGMPSEAGWTLANYQSVYGDPSTLALAWNSAVFAIGSMVIALGTGMIMAWLIERTDLPGRSLLRFLVIVPMAMPPMLLAIAWVLILSPNVGAVNVAAREIFGMQGPLLNIYTFGGMIFVQGLSLVPTTYLILAPTIRNMDATLEEAAAASGAAPLKVFYRVTLPLLAPALIASAAFVVILGFVVFDIPGILGLPANIYVLSSEIFYRSQPPAGLPDYGGISALAVTFLILLMILSWFYQRMTSQSQRFVTVGGKATRGRTIPLKKWKPLAVVFTWGYLFFAAFLPFVMLLATSLMPYYSGLSAEVLGKLSFGNYATLLSEHSIMDAAQNSIVVAVVAATIVVVLSAGTSWYVVRSRGPLRKTFDIVAFLPLAIPNVMIGLALIYVYLTLNFLPVYGTIAILVIAYATSYLSFGTRATNGVLMQFSRDLEEAGQTSGARPLAVFSKITFPMMRPALVGVWVWVAAHALRELSGALMLQGADNAVLPTVLWGYWESGRPTIAAAAGVGLIVAVFLLVCIWGAVGSRTERRRA